MTRNLLLSFSLAAIVAKSQFLRLARSDESKGPKGTRNLLMKTWMPPLGYSIELTAVIYVKCTNAGRFVWSPRAVDLYGSKSRLPNMFQDKRTTHMGPP